MKKYFFLIVVLFAFGQVYHAGAQTYQPMPVMNSSWKVARCFYFFPDSVHDEMRVRIPGNDTILHSIMYKNIYLDVHSSVYSGHDTTYSYLYGAMREADKRIYIVNYYCGDSAEHLVYDFTHNTVGDTIYTQKDAINCDTISYMHIITGIDSILVGSQYHRRLHVSDTNNSHDEYWTEGVGSNYGLIYATHWETDNSYDLICLATNDTIRYVNPTPNYSYCQNPPTVVCDSIVVIPESVAGLQANDGYNIYPNPITAGQHVTVSFQHPVSQGSSINVLNSVGQTLKHVAIPAMVTSYQLDISALANGLYFISVKESDKISAFRMKLLKM